MHELAQVKADMEMNDREYVPEHQFNFIIDYKLITVANGYLAQYFKLFSHYCLTATR